MCFCVGVIDRIELFKFDISLSDLFNMLFESFLSLAIFIKRDNLVLKNRERFCCIAEAGMVKQHPVKLLQFGISCLRGDLFGE